MLFIVTTISLHCCNQHSLTALKVVVDWFLKWVVLPPLQPQPSLPVSLRFHIKYITTLSLFTVSSFYFFPHSSILINQQHIVINTCINVIHIITPLQHLTHLPKVVQRIPQESLQKYQQPPPPPKCLWISSTCPALPPAAPCGWPPRLSAWSWTCMRPTSWKANTWRPSSWRYEFTHCGMQSIN